MICALRPKLHYTNFP